MRSAPDRSTVQATALKRNSIAVNCTSAKALSVRRTKDDGSRFKNACQEFRFKSAVQMHPHRTDAGEHARELFRGRLRQT